MRVLIQRVAKASVTFRDKVISKIDQGLLIFVCAMSEDSESQAEVLAKKISNLRIFSDSEGKMNKSIIDIKGQCLVVSQFTLAADTKRGNRPGFSYAAKPDKGLELYEYFADFLSSLNIETQKGVFGEDMMVNIENDGPTTIWIDTDD
tara:strand:+ start:95 stop:538 length:444 start_codon:yes stop_codon:yes gene_type:complete